MRPSKCSEMKIPALLAILLLGLYTNAAIATEVWLDLDQPNWQTLVYKNIPANTVRQGTTDTSIEIEVNASASPLIYVFDRPQTMESISVNGEIIGELPDIPAGLQQGAPGADDFAFRIGLVIAGDKRLNFVQRLIATDWVTTLYGLAPKGEGIDHVRFLNLANPGSITWQQRTHPDSKGLFVETIAGRMISDGRFELSYRLPVAQRILALWISSDGDDTDSKYIVRLNSIQYQ